MKIKHYIIIIAGILVAIYYCKKVHDTIPQD
jgi:hypothetical protein